MPEALDTQEPALEDQISQAITASSQDEVPEQTEPLPGGQEVPEITEELEALLAPEHWKAEHQDEFNKLGGIDGGRTWQQFLLDRHKDMEGDYTRKTQSLADERKQFETQFNEYQQYNQLVAPMAQQWQMQGMSPIQGIQQLLGYAQALQQNPKEVLLHLAQQHGVDLESAFGEQPYVDPQVQAMQTQLQQMQSAFQQTQTQQQQSQQTAVVQQIQQFAEATDDKGQPLRPHFENVYDQMVQLIQLGHAQDLETAYDKAVQLNPDIQAQLRAEQEKADALERQAKAKKAQQAATVVDSNSTEIQTPAKTLEEEIEAAFDAQVN